ncbi:MAG: hypothetical protein ACOVQR_03885, partial [Flavobacterium sp.]
MNKRILFAFFSCLIVSLFYGQNLIQNGGFESGNGIGFQSDYNFFNPGGGQANSTPRQYAIINNPFLLNTNNFVNSGDYTTGSGLMMVCDGASGQSENFWKTNGDVLLQGGQTYRFKYFVRSVNPTNPQPQIGFRVMQGGTNLFTGTYNVTAPSNGWQEVSHEFTVTGTGNQYRRLELYNINQSAVGNDFAIDEISLRAVLALTANHSVINVSCFGANDGAIVIYGNGGNPPYTSFSISGAVNDTNTSGVFTNLPPGVYTVSVTDSSSTTATTAGVVISQPNDLTVPSNSAVCLGNPITLTAASGGNYTWTANPADPTLTNPNNSSITVTPLITTTYTVNSSVSTPRNLLYNGNFSLGAVGFTTDYQYLDPVSPFGVQGAYAVVPNAQGWFAGFSNCTDHTTGTGNMLVADGSTANGGNDRVWCQTIPVTPGQAYSFSYWVQSVAAGNAANLEVMVNGVSIGIGTAPVATCSWLLRLYGWNAGAATTAEICIYNRTTVASGNDFAIDDLRFEESSVCNLSKSVTVTVNEIPVVSVAASATCFGTSGTITATPQQAGTFTYAWTVPSGATNPGSVATFTTTVAGTYTVTITNTATNCVSLPASVNYIINPIPTVTVNSETICDGTTANIVATPGTTAPYNYVWTVPAGVPDPGNVPSFYAGVAGNYSVVITDNLTGCVSASATGTITVQSIVASATFGTNQTICPGNTAILTFTGTPNGVVTFSSSSGAFYTVTLNAAGTASFTTPVLTATTIYTLETITLNPPGCSNPLSGSVTITIEANGCASVLAGDLNLNPFIPSICNVGECVDLLAEYIDLGSTTAYTVSSIPYCPQAAFQGPGFTPVSVNIDDVWSGNIALPFNFCFFGVNYATANIGSNGVISFDTYAAGSYCNWPFTQTIPNAGFPIRNAIYGVYQDINPAVAPTAPAVTSINYQLMGSYPCRKLVVNFSNVAQFSCNNNVGLQTSQVVLYEISNIIEVYVQRRVPCLTWNSGNGLIGIQNSAGSLAYTPPGRNTGTWSAFNEAWRFTPSGPSATTFTWFEGATPLGNNPQINVCPTTTTTYTAQAVYDMCGQITTVTRDITVYVNPDLTNQPQDLSSCNPQFDLTLNTPIILGSLNPGDYDISYFLNQTDAELFANPILNPTAFLSTGQTIYVGIQDFNTGCNYVKSFNLILNDCSLDPQPNPLVECDGPNNDGFAFFDLTQSDAAALNGLNPALYTVTYHLSQANADIGSLPINPANAFNGTNQIIYVRVEDNSDATIFGTTSFTLTVNPTPLVTVNDDTICDGQTATITATPNVAGTFDYSWTVPTGASNPGNVATFTTTVAGVYSVIITDTTTNCVSPSASGTVTVNPNPTVTVNSPAVCAGASATVTATPGVAGTYSY